ncbi:MAG: VWA domain-containing protein [Acidobacteriota bacterium]
MAQEPKYGESIEVQLVEVDLVVTDRTGRHVTGLTAKDFEVFEGGRRQQITNLTEYRGASARPSSGEQYQGPSVHIAAITPETKRLPQTLLVLIDALPRQGRARVMQDLETLVDSVIREGDRVSIVFWSPGYERARTLLNLTTDQDDVRIVMHALATTESVGSAARALARETVLRRQFGEKTERTYAGKGLDFTAAAMEEEGVFSAAEQELVLFRRKSRAIRRLISALGGTRGRKSLFYVAADFRTPEDTIERMSAVAELENLTREANAQGVTVYAASPAAMDDPDPTARDARSATRAPLLVRQHEMDALRYLTIPTGGSYEVGTTDAVERAGATLTSDVSFYYSLAYHAERDGHEHERRLVVRARNGNYRVRKRNSVVQKPYAVQARDMLLSAISSEATRDDLGISVQEGTVVRQSEDRWVLPLVVRIPSASLQYALVEKERVAEVRILVQAGSHLDDATPLMEDDLRVVAGKNDVGGTIRYSMKVLIDGRGTKISVGVLDRLSGLMSVATVDGRRQDQ